MAFDKTKFLQEKFTPREEDVPVPDMKEFFTDLEPEFVYDEKGDSVKNPSYKDPVWKIRGLTGIELGRVHEAEERNKNITAILEGLVKSNDREKINSIRDLVGLSDKVPNEIARRIEMLMIASIDPVCDLDLAKKICRIYAADFYNITNRIIALTGRSHIPGKVTASGETQKSSSH